MDAKRRGGQGLNPEELVSDKTRDHLRAFWYGTQDWMEDGPPNDESLDAGDMTRAFNAGFYLALEELGIERVVEVGPSCRQCERYHQDMGGCTLKNTCGTTKGHLLVRAKDRTP